jgi:manganese oxidase
MAAPKDPTNSVSYDKKSKTWTYKVVALEAPIFFNDFGDHNHDGMMFALKRYSDEINDHAKLTRDALKAISAARKASFHFQVPIRATIHLPEEIETLFHHLNGLGNSEVQDHLREIMQLESTERKELLRTHPMVRPLVLRGRIGETIQIELENEIKQRHVGMHLIAGGYGASSDGTKIGDQSSLVAPPEIIDEKKVIHKRQYTWKCEHEGVFVFHDMGDPDGDEDGTNAHGLFGALIVEPANTWWTDPEEAAWSDSDCMSWARDNAHGMLAVDVHQRTQTVLEKIPADKKDKCPNGSVPETRSPKHAQELRSFREFVIFIHDEPENHDPHWLESIKNYAHDEHKPEAANKLANKPAAAEHAPHDGGSLMCINYRSEQMKYRKQLIQKWTNEGLLERAVLDEDQHHSSWLFGDPATPVLRAYIGDPVRIHLVHAGVKETHVFHLHVYEWNTDPKNQDSPLIDAISISPGGGHTIIPLFGAGNVQTVAGDVIWHCHLYPHFHMGMWGMLRTFDTLQSGKPGPELEPGSDASSVYHGRKIGHYPDGSRINNLEPLPDREPPPAPTIEQPGYPLFIAGKPYQKSPIPPWPSKNHAYVRPKNEHEYDYREPSTLEAKAMQTHAKPGELFTSFGHPTQKATWQEGSSGKKDKLVKHPEFSARAHTIAVTNDWIVFNNDGWHDPDGHFFFMPDQQKPGREGNQGSTYDHGHGKNETPQAIQQRQQALNNPDNVREPLFFRCQHGEVLELTLENRLRPMNTNPFDFGLPATDPGNNHAIVQELFGKNDFLGECGLHVHLVKFDPICADGASTGWNYLSAPSMGKKMIYRWWADEEFGTIFFHDHLFANTRQRHGLYGALLVEPQGSKFHDPWTDQEIVAGTQAVIKLPDGQQFREFCVGVGDWIATYDRNGKPLEGPDHLGSHGDNGLMCVNYRSAPLKERGPDSSLWFSSKGSLGAKGDPDTTIFETYAGEPVWLRLIQGSHEEQHSFQIHGLRWDRLRNDINSPVRNQQTLGISEAFTFKLDGPVFSGDYLWKFAGIDDTWLGCWGLIRAHDNDSSSKSSGPKPLAANVWTKIDEAHQHGNGIISTREQNLEQRLLGAPVRKYKIAARQAEIEYRDGTHPQGSITDPFGLYFHAISMTAPGGEEIQFEYPNGEHLEPMILRAIEGERLEITLENQLPKRVRSEPLWAAPELDLEQDDEGDENSPHKNSTQQRNVSESVSIHADMVLYDVSKNDGVTAGRNEVQHVKRGEHRTYTWFADQVGSCLLQDMADLRNHRHHGLVGALIVEPKGSVPLEVPAGTKTAPAKAKSAWTGSRATIVSNADRREEVVLLLQDGLRLFKDGKVPPASKKDDLYPRDIPGDPMTKEEIEEAKAQAKLDGRTSFSKFKKPDNEDQGQKAFNYRTALLDLALEDSKSLADQKLELDLERLRDDLSKKRIKQNQFDAEKQALEKIRDQWITQRGHNWFDLEPATPTFVVPSGANVDFHLVCAADRPRNHSFTIHGHSWQEYPHRQADSPVISAESAISSGTVRTFSFKANAEPGDYLYRSGITKWTIAQGLWGILRVD